MLFLLIFVTAVSAAVPNLYQKRYDLGDKPLYNPRLIEGDIAGFSQYGQKPSMRNAIISDWEVWPNGEVPYTLHWSVDTIHNEILEGMAEYHQKTCIKFVPKQDSHKDWIEIGWYDGCWSMVGRQGGKQSVSIGAGCHWKGLVVHELGHAIGFNHEHQRSDRDKYVYIYFDNIYEGMESNFEKLKPYENNFLGESYDLTSVMQYESEAFSKDGVSPVIVALDHTVLVPVWKKDGLSEVDVRRVKKLYQCDGNIRPLPPPIPPITCDFDKDECGFVSQDNMEPYERVWATLGGVTDYVMMIDASKAKSGAGRLYSPDLNSYRRKTACASFKYYIHGDGIVDLKVQLQLRGVAEDMVLLDAREGGDTWKEFKTELKLIESDYWFRVFFTVGLKPGVEGKIALDKMSLDLNGC